MANDQIDERAAKSAMTRDEYLAALRRGWDEYLGKRHRLLVGMSEAAGMPAPGSALDVHGDWQRGSTDGD